MLVKKFPEALDDVDMLKIIDQKLKDVEKARIENGVFCEVLIADRTLVFWWKARLDFGEARYAAVKTEHKAHRLVEADIFDLYHHAKD